MAHALLTPPQWFAPSGCAPTIAHTIGHGVNVCAYGSVRIATRCAALLEAGGQLSGYGSHCCHRPPARLVIRQTDPSSGKITATLDSGVRGQNTVDTSLTFSPDGKTLVASVQERVTLWDATSRTLLVPPLQEPGTVTGTMFSPNGQLLAFDEDDEGGGTLVIRYGSADLWMSEACRVAHRNFTRAEWLQFFPGESYRKTCPAFPDLENT